MVKREELYRGKAKSVFKTDDADRLILLFRNDTSEFDGKRRFGLLTDLGSYCDGVLDSYRGLDALMIEANHCRDLLARGHYPWFLKQRVGGQEGHLNNHQAASLVAELGWKHLQHLVLAHLSSKNNLPQLARQCFVDTLGCDPDWLQLADQDSGLDWRTIA